MQAAGTGRDPWARFSSTVTLALDAVRGRNAQPDHAPAGAAGAAAGAGARRLARLWACCRCRYPEASPQPAPAPDGHSASWRSSSTVEEAVSTFLEEFLEPVSASELVDRLRNKWSAETEPAARAEAEDGGPRMLGTPQRSPTGRSLRGNFPIIREDDTDPMQLEERDSTEVGADLGSPTGAGQLPAQSAATCLSSTGTGGDSDPDPEQDPEGGVATASFVSPPSAAVVPGIATLEKMKTEPESRVPNPADVSARPVLSDAATSPWLGAAAPRSPLPPESIREAMAMLHQPPLSWASAAAPGPAAAPAAAGRPRPRGAAEGAPSPDARGGGADGPGAAAAAAEPEAEAARSCRAPGDAHSAEARPGLSIGAAPALEAGAAEAEVAEAARHVEAEPALDTETDLDAAAAQEAQAASVSSSSAVPLPALHQALGSRAAEPPARGMTDPSSPASPGAVATSTCSEAASPQGSPEQNTAATSGGVQLLVQGLASELAPVGVAASSVLRVEQHAEAEMSPGPMPALVSAISCEPQETGAVLRPGAGLSCPAVVLITDTDTGVTRPAVLVEPVVTAAEAEHALNTEGEDGGCGPAAPGAEPEAPGAAAEAEAQAAARAAAGAPGRRRGPGGSSPVTTSSKTRSAKSQTDEQAPAACSSAKGGGARAKASSGDLSTLAVPSSRSRSATSESLAPALAQPRASDSSRARAAAMAAAVARGMAAAAAAAAGGRSSNASTLSGLTSVGPVAPAVAASEEPSPRSATKLANGSKPSMLSSLFSRDPAPASSMPSTAPAEVECQTVDVGALELVDGCEAELPHILGDPGTVDGSSAEQPLPSAMLRERGNSAPADPSRVNMGRCRAKFASDGIARTSQAAAVGPQRGREGSDTLPVTPTPSASFLADLNSHAAPATLNHEDGACEECSSSASASRTRVFSPRPPRRRTRSGSAAPAGEAPRAASPASPGPLALEDLELQLAPAPRPEERVSLPADAAPAEAPGPAAAPRSPSPPGRPPGAPGARGAAAEATLGVGDAETLEDAPGRTPQEAHCSSTVPEVILPCTSNCSPTGSRRGSADGALGAECAAHTPAASELSAPSLPDLWPLEEIPTKTVFPAKSSLVPEVAVKESSETSGHHRPMASLQADGTVSCGDDGPSFSSQQGALLQAIEGLHTHRTSECAEAAEALRPTLSAPMAQLNSPQLQTAPHGVASAEAEGRVVGIPVAGAALPPLDALDGGDSREGWGTELSAEDATPTTLAQSTSFSMDASGSWLGIGAAMHPDSPTATSAAWSEGSVAAAQRAAGAAAAPAARARPGDRGASPREEAPRGPQPPGAPPGRGGGDLAGFGFQQPLSPRHGEPQQARGGVLGPGQGHGAPRRGAEGAAGGPAAHAPQRQVQQSSRRGKAKQDRSAPGAGQRPRAARSATPSSAPSPASSTRSAQLRTPPHQGRAGNTLVPAKRGNLGPAVEGHSGSSTHVVYLALNEAERGARAAARRGPAARPYACSSAPAPRTSPAAAASRSRPASRGAARQGGALRHDSDGQPEEEVAPEGTCDFAGIII